MRCAGAVRTDEREPIRPLGCRRVDRAVRPAIRRDDHDPSTVRVPTRLRRGVHPGRHGDGRRLGHGDPRSRHDRSAGRHTGDPRVPGPPARPDPEQHPERGGPRGRRVRRIDRGRRDPPGRVGPLRRDAHVPDRRRVDDHLDVRARHGRLERRPEGRTRPVPFRSGLPRRVPIRSSVRPRWQRRVGPRPWRSSWSASPLPWPSSAASSCCDGDVPGRRCPSAG